ncbi:MAG: phenylalanine--tRNA ligase subunit beta [Pirellulaceae bacterium]
MIVSWNWLQEYVSLKIDPAEIAARLAMAGLNHESTERIGEDLAIDLEVTSNRPDCLGHLGIAREISVLCSQPLRIPDPQPPTGGPDVGRITKVSITCPDLCTRYTARVIRGVKIGPSPAWLANRLQSIGMAVINNVVDISNYVMMECGQPLHVFDLQRLGGPEIIVREAWPQEQFPAIDHRIYPLAPGMCVIADAQRAVALAGVMGGLESEVHDATTDLLIESAEFSPLSIRTTARKLGLHSPSSYRFERGVDPVGVEWASRRCCQLIVELAGGQLAPGILDVGAPFVRRAAITLRLSQLPRILGIEIPGSEVERILTALGNERMSDAHDESLLFLPPSWRRDLTREIDLIEEVGRIYGYDQIPEDVGVPMAASHRTHEDRVLERVRQGLTAAGFDEALTASVVPRAWCDALSPWSSAQPLTASTPMLKGADTLRMSLIPSLLEARRLNESVANDPIELFESARIYLAESSGLPREQWTLAATSSGDFHQLKGAVETLLELLHVTAPLTVGECALPLLDPARQGRLELEGRLLGYLGEVNAQGLKQFGLRAPTTVLELDLGVLADVAVLVPQQQALSDFPAIARDLNLVVDESIQWADLAATIRAAAGPLLEVLRFQEVYRDKEKDGADKKRLLFSITLRSSERTLTSEEADALRDQVVAAARENHQAMLLG